MVLHMYNTHCERFDSIALIIGRLGFLCRGFVWASVGGVAMSAAFTGEKTQGTNGALEIIADRPGGAVFLVLVTIGVFCYAAWRFFEGFYGLKIKKDSGRFANVINGIVTPFCSCIAYLAFGIANIVSVRDGIRHGDQEDNGNSFSQRMADNGFGKAVLVAGGIVLFATSIMWLVGLVKGSFKKELDQDRLNKRPYFKIPFYSFIYLGMIGRAGLFAVLATLLLRVTFDSGIKFGGFGHALAQLQNNTFGRIVLVVIGFFMILFGCSSVFQAFYKQFLKYHPHLIRRKEDRDNIKARLRGNSVAEKSVPLEPELDQQQEVEKQNAVYEMKEKKNSTDPVHAV